MGRHVPVLVCSRDDAVMAAVRSVLGEQPEGRPRWSISQLRRSDDLVQHPHRVRDGLVIIHASELDQPSLATVSQWVPVVMVAGDEQDGLDVLLALRRGAAGLVSLTNDLRSLPRACRLALAERAYLSPAFVDVLAKHVRSGGTEAIARLGLTPREAQVLRCLVDGHARQVIADRLGVRERTVKHHLSSIYRKLGVSDRANAIGQAYRLGLVH